MSRTSGRLSGVSYGAVGASQAPDLMSYPPKGFRPAEYRTRIGHGDQRFRAAAEQALTWQLQQRSGIRVRVDDVPPPDETAYIPVVFDASGAPVAPSAPRDTGELQYSSEGVALLSAGTTATLTLNVLGIPFQAPIRVVQLIDDQRRRGFVVGTMRGHPLSGEESFVIEQTDDGAVWINYRVFWRPGGAGWRLVKPLLALLQRQYATRYLRALQAAADVAMPTATTEVVPAEEPVVQAPPRERARSGSDAPVVRIAGDHAPGASDSDEGETDEPYIHDLEPLPEVDSPRESVRSTAANDDSNETAELTDQLVDPADLPTDAAAMTTGTPVQVPAAAIQPPASAPEPDPEPSLPLDVVPEPVTAAQLNADMPEPVVVPEADAGVAADEGAADAAEAEAESEAEVSAEALTVVEGVPDDSEPAAEAESAPEVEPAAEAEPAVNAEAAAETESADDGVPAENETDSDPAGATSVPSAQWVDRMQTSPLNLLGRPRDRPLLEGLPTLRDHRDAGQEPKITPDAVNEPQDDATTDEPRDDA